MLPFLAAQAWGISGGTETSDWPAVVGLYASEAGFAGDLFCSGTLVAPEAVLTCAHCVDRLRDYQEGNADVYVIVGTAAVGGIDTFAQVIDSVQFATWVPDSDYDTEQGSDIALLRLDGPVPGVDPLPMNEAPVDDSWVGTELTFVGWGATTAEQIDGGVKRTVDIPVTSYDDLWVTHGAKFSGINTCFGDSGGSVFRTFDDGVTRLVAIPAVIWGAPDTDICVDGYGWDLRVDARLDFVRDTLALWAEPAADTGADTAVPRAATGPTAEDGGCGCRTLHEPIGREELVFLALAGLGARRARRTPFR